MGADNENNGLIYDVAFSFAGEQRDFVSRVYKILTEKYKIKIFYDQNPEIQAKLWGKDLTEEFEKVYGEQSKWCVLFISKEYKEKYWTNYEKKSALTKALQNKGDYILPARFDDTEIPGILNTVGYINASKMSPDELSEMIRLKLGIPSEHRAEQKQRKGEESKRKEIKKQDKPENQFWENPGRLNKQIESGTRENEPKESQSTQITQTLLQQDRKRTRAIMGVIGIILGILLIFNLASSIGSDSNNANSSQLSDVSSSQSSDVNRSYFQQAKYNSSAWENQKYSSVRVGDKNYVPLKPDSNKIAELFLNNGDKYTIKKGDGSFDLGRGYTLEAKNVDVDGKKVWLEFSKDGQYIDDQIISTDRDSDKTWTCILDNIQGEDNVPVLKVHVNQVFQGAVEGIAQIDGLWLIDFTNVSSVTLSNN